jgi:hypothetical protein
MCADRHWKLVYKWISAHITLLVEHTPISGSFMFFSITIIRGHLRNPWSVSKIFREFHYYHRSLLKALFSNAKSSFSGSKTLLLALPKAVSCFCMYKHL